MATHSLQFLSLPHSEAEYVLVRRDADGITRTELITSDVFGALDRRVRDAGLASRAELVQVLRAVLLVEGAHDEMVLGHFFGSGLGEHRILLLPVRGAKKVRLLAEAELLARLGLPLIILFDETTARHVIAAEPPAGRNVAARAVWELLRNWPSDRQQPHIVSFDMPDIFRALPERCLQQSVAACDGTFPGWRAIDQGFKAAPAATGFKQFLLHRCGLAGTDPTDLLAMTLERCRLGPHASLAAAVEEVFHRVAVL